MSKKILGLPASNGIVSGPVWIYRPIQLSYKTKNFCDPQEELSRLDNAVGVAKKQLQGLMLKTKDQIGEEEAQILEAHKLILEDPELKNLVIDLLENKRINAEAAVDQSIEQYANSLQALDSEYFRERAQDVRDVGRRLILCLQGVKTSDAKMPENPVIILADELTPSDTVQFDPNIILGFCTIRGGPTSHTAILARSLNVPAIVSAKFKLEEVLENSLAIMNGSDGYLLLNPEKKQVTKAKKALMQQEEIWQKHLSNAHKPAITLDHQEIEVVANIGSAEDAQKAIEFGAEGVGLLRTEFLYINHEELPSFDDQVKAYRQISNIMGDRPVVIRTLDIGGDKNVPYLDFKDEQNPFLGWRAIRMIGERPDIFEVQLKALLTGFSGSDLRIMLPMVSQIEEVENAKSIFNNVVDDLKRNENFVHPKLQFGIMVEIPSTALMVESFADHVDFFSIGTNDLAQYTLAVDRTNERVANLASPFNSAVIKLIAMTIKGAHKNNRWVGLCGEMAGNPLATPLLIGLGLDEFSMAPNSIPRIKHIIRSLEKEKCQQIAHEVLRKQKTKDIMALLESVQVNN